ncbi:porin [Pararobbsia alpina]|uniref:Outer membrane porin protein n=1 Tax=Pararobbsia alpina TaxID=621374 RepID=A0A6S7C5J7_9BURK|nr:porin [Pararobbsia alpina]CAB3781724.1 Outer membrane porin protein [Pararobbsia alpina]
MKKALLTASLLAAGIVTAHAQSSVTLYGRLDGGIEYVNGLKNGHRVQAQSGDWGTSLWGMKGAEDLGGGTQAIFKLESGFLIQNGTVGGVAGSLFNRYALVGLTNPVYGTFQMGRSLFISNGVWDFDPFVQENWSSASLVRGRNWPQVSNSFNYQSPSFAGLDFSGQYALSNSTNFNGNNNAGTPGAVSTTGRAAGAQITYTSSFIQVRGIYDEIRDGNGQFSNLFAFSREYTVGVNLTFGPVKVQAAYQHLNANAVTDGSPTSADHEWLGATYQFTPAAALTVGGYHVNLNKGGGNATLYEMTGTYNLSKRTFLYITGATVQNSSTANFSLFAEPPDNSAAFNTNNATAIANSQNPFPGHSQSGVFAGIDHSF